MHSELCCLETYAGAIHFIFALGCSCLPAWWCKQNGSRDCRSSIEISVFIWHQNHNQADCLKLKHTFTLRTISKTTEIIFQMSDSLESDNAWEQGVIIPTALKNASIELIKGRCHIHAKRQVIWSCFIECGCHRFGVHQSIKSCIMSTLSQSVCQCVRDGCVLFC